VELQEADPRAARRAVALVAAASLLGAAGVMLWGQRRPEVEAWILEDPALTTERVRLALGLLGLAGGLPMACFAAYFWHLGSAARRTGRFPPPGVAVVRDTWVLTGDAARRRAHVIRLFALVLLALGVAMPLLLWQTGRTLGR
jgi:uncharacterized iron-regulated membrane protein